MIVRPSNALRRMLGVDHHLGPHVVAAGDERGGALRPEHRGAFGAHFLELRQPPLVAPPPPGDAALEPMLLELELGVEPLGVALFLGEHLLGPRVEPAIADFGAADRAAVEPQGLLGQPRQEGTVVADHDERAGESRQPLLEPFDRGDVEMVGRLVEQQHVGVLRQRADDRGAAALAARRGRGLARQVDAELVGDRVGFVPRGRVRVRRARNRRASRTRRPCGSCSSSTTLVPGTIVRRPSSASIAPAISFISVVLPAPLRPISASRSRSPI